MRRKQMLWHSFHAMAGAALAAAPLTASPTASAQTARSSLFNEVTAQVGLVEKPPRYPDGTYRTPEITPGGVAVLDYNNDGRPDLLVICHPPPGPYAEMIRSTAPNRLFAQQPDGTFKEVPGAAGLAGKGFHHGVAVGDVNNDGFSDVYVTNYASPDELFLNNGNGTFTDVTDRAGLIKMSPEQAARGPQPRRVAVGGPNWSSTAAFVDYDRDGNLDLFVAQFATFDPNKKCAGSASANDLDYCGPHTFPGQLATLYRGNGDGTFTDVTRQVGIDTPARGWGLICADLTGDGLPDFFQANDEEPNQLWVNQGVGGGGDARFIDEAVLRGCAFNAAGNVEANMGVAVGDVANAGRLDLFSTHITSETNTLWMDQSGGSGGGGSGSGGQWADVTATAGMGAIDRPFTGWGCGFLDYDNDGNLDLAVVNGRVAKGPVRPDSPVGPFWNKYAEPNLLFRGDGAGHFTDVSRDAGSFAARPEVTRALAFADLSNRGAFDLVTVSLDNNVRVYRNAAAAASGNHWLQVLPMTGRRDAIGAKVYLTAGGRKRLALCLRNTSYLAASDPRVHFGLGKIDKVDAIEIAWPSGTPAKERFDASGVDRLLVLKQGEGKPE
jgi:hypothetical protein